MHQYTSNKEIKDLSNTQKLNELLEEFLQIHHDGSFARMVCNYIHTTGMTPQEVEELLEAMRQEMTKNE